MKTAFEPIVRYNPTNVVKFVVNAARHALYFLGARFRICARPPAVRVGAVGGVSFLKHLARVAIVVHRSGTDECKSPIIKNMNRIDAIQLALKEAQAKRKKMAMFHSQVLLNAELLKNMDPHEFCRNVGLTKAYHTEFRKMIAVVCTLSELGYSIQKDK